MERGWITVTDHDGNDDDGSGEMRVSIIGEVRQGSWASFLNSSNLWAIYGARSIGCMIRDRIGYTRTPAFAYRISHIDGDLNTGYEYIGSCFD